MVRSRQKKINCGVRGKNSYGYHKGKKDDDEKSPAILTICLVRINHFVCIV